MNRIKTDDQKYVNSETNSKAHGQSQSMRIGRESYSRITSSDHGHLGMAVTILCFYVYTAFIGHSSQVNIVNFEHNRNPFFVDIQ